MDESRRNAHSQPKGSRDYDVVVVGGGPAGLFATFYAGLRSMRACLVDAAPQLGGQLAALYPEKWIYDVGGFPKVRSSVLVDQLVEQAGRFHADMRVGTQVLDVADKGDGFSLRLSDGEELRARGVIIAAGLGSFRPKRLPALGLEKWEGRGLAYAVGRLENLRDKRVVMAGGGDTAVDWALMAVGVASEVVLVHRRDEFRAHEESVRALKSSPVRLKLSSEVVGAEGDDLLERVHIQNKVTGEVEVVPCDRLLGFLGFQAQLGPIAQWGLEMDRNAIRTDHMGQTSRRRVYAVGDIASYPGKFKLIAIAFSEAAMAVSHLKTLLEPKAALQPAHSSGMDLDGSVR